MWILAALGSAVFAGATTLLSKLGIKNTDSDLHTTIRTATVLIFAWFLCLCDGSFFELGTLSLSSLVFLLLSGLATGASWLSYFKALSLASVHEVSVLDKSSSVLTIVLALILFGDAQNIALKLMLTAVFAVGIYLMLDTTNLKFNSTTPSSRQGLIYAALSALFAMLTTILAKYGIGDISSNLATAVRTTVILPMCILVLFVKGKLSFQSHAATLDRSELGFIVRSGISTGISWLMYFYALQTGIVSAVAAIDKLSLLVSIGGAALLFHEELHKKAGGGTYLPYCGKCRLGICISNRVSTLLHSSS